MVATLLATTLAAGALDIEYARPGQPLVPHEGKALVFSRIRFFYDGKEFFPCRSPRSDAVDALLGIRSGQARHVWLRRLEIKEFASPLRPDVDGSLTI